MINHHPNYQLSDPDPLASVPAVEVWLQFGPSYPLSHEHLSLAVHTPETHGELQVSRKVKYIQKNHHERFNYGGWG